LARQGLKDFSRWRKPPENIPEIYLPRQGQRNHHAQMPSTHLSLHYHLVFSTKDRAGTISPIWRPRLHAFLGGVVNQLDGVPEKIGGVSDHVHLLIGLKATHRLADVLREIKSVSSRWVHEEIGLQPFAWQEGYGAFTVSSTQLGAVSDYIERQEEHHRTQSFQDEYREFLERAAVKYDERFLW
jgi:REP element-mobilizing transposase RayT